MVKAQGTGPILNEIVPGDMAERVRAFDWSRTSIGPFSAWPPALRQAVDMVLAANVPMALRWGPDMELLYNDSYNRVIGGADGEALGRKLADAEPELRQFFAPILQAIMSGRSAGYAVRDVTFRTRGGRTEPYLGYFNASFSPVPDPGAETGVGGILITLTETTQDRKVERDLAASEERLQLALEASGGIGAWDWDIAGDRVYADAPFARLHGVDPELAAQGVKGAELVNAIHPDDLDRVGRARASSLQRPGAFADEYRLLQPDGSARWVYARGHTYHEAGKAVRHRGVLVDITDRKRTEAALQVAEADLRIAVDAAGLGRWDYQPLTGQRFWDERCRKIYGLPPGNEDLGAVFEALVHPEDLPGLQDAVAAAMDPEGPGAINREYRIRRGDDGTERWIETFGRAFFESGRCVRFVGVASDVTERKAAATSQMLREATMAMAMDAANVGTWDYDARNDSLTWSERCYAMFGMSADAPVTLETFYDRLNAQDAAAVRSAFDRALDPGVRADFDMEYRAVGRDDRVERWIAAKGKAFFDESGQALRVVGATVDITERKRLELHLRLLVNELNHRVKNTLATIQAIAAQSFHAARSLPEAKEAFTARIIALSEAHDLLTQENWEGAQLLDVLARLNAVHGGEARFDLDGPGVRLSPRSALSLSMALHELATNAAKSGALPTPAGRVRIA